MARFNRFMRLPVMAALILASGNDAFGQGTQGEIRGLVVEAETGAGLEGAIVRLADLGHHTVTDEHGHFRLQGIPIGQQTVVVQRLGYRELRDILTVRLGQMEQILLELETAIPESEEITVTASRVGQTRRESPTVVTTISPETFRIIGAESLAEGLNFAPGVRLENNCQNCGFTQVRMNGLEGAYSQVLINGRPIFSGLAGVYGLEMIPPSMIGEVEIVRGGASALYGSNAVAGTINVLLVDPATNSFEATLIGGRTGVGVAEADHTGGDHSLSVNGTVVSDDLKTGAALFGFHRDRSPFDINGDSFSEVAAVTNTTFGGRFFHWLDDRSKLVVDFFNINEDRRGGDRFDYPAHEAHIAEELDHRITSGAATLERHVRDRDVLSIYLSGQAVARKSYYGAQQSLSDYGTTRDFSWTAGTQYALRFHEADLVAGVEHQGSSLRDEKLGYPSLSDAYRDTAGNLVVPHVGNRLIADQTIGTWGLFAQYEHRIDRVKLSGGARFDYYRIDNGASGEQSADEVAGTAVSPRAAILVDLNDQIQMRGAYSAGYRAPQIFDEDLHIAASGSRRIEYRNDPDLQKELSHSFTGSLEFTPASSLVDLRILLEGFRTRLLNPFAVDFGSPDASGAVVYERFNSPGGAVVEGFNVEVEYAPAFELAMKAGFTAQRSLYDEPQEFGEVRFLRTPDRYGFLSLDWQPIERAGVTFNAVYTGPMLVPYFGNRLDDPQRGELRRSEEFLDVGVRARFNPIMPRDRLQVFIGAKNLLNSYQSDFDLGIDRDPAYVYGPVTPREAYVGATIRL